MHTMDKSPKNEVTVVGIGSSAGGLEAILQLVVVLPLELPVAYVVVQHMSPKHKSQMTELVSRDTALEVRTIKDRTVPEKNIIYITPPKNDVVIEEGVLRLVTPSKEVGSPKPSVNRFFISLAKDRGTKSVGIILSGTGSDGTYGIQAIRETGGITMAQDNDSAKYDGMPRSAVQSGCVDLVLSPDQIGEHLPKILTSPRDFAKFRSENLSESPHADLLQILLARTQVDFRDYKPSTIGRRIDRRMVALGINTEEEYTEYCRNNPAAVDALFKDLLISVTRFFRDKDEFKELAQLLPKLIENKEGEQLRIWIAGCATGEEAYSIAMLVCEAIGCSTAAFNSKVQMFATDIDVDALAIARRGVYSSTALDDIPSKFADKYLVRQVDEIRIVDSLRRAVLFSEHNVCQAPPFQKIDLVCCRNLMIYFSNTLQKKVFERFHYSMTAGSLMFLGTAESIAGSDEFFVAEKRAAHVYSKRRLPKRGVLAFDMPNPAQITKPKTEVAKKTDPSVDRQLLQALSKAIGPNSILVTEEFFIAEVFGDVSQYISLNNASNLRMNLDLLRSPLKEEARTLIKIALKTGSRRSGVRHLLAESDENQVRLDVYPIIADNINERVALLIFTPVEIEEALKLEKLDSSITNETVAKRIQLLEKEIETTREALQQTIEELETSNEELQSLNEELQSTNEELQATNEELETSNEELQSTNEELITVNEELQVTTTELKGRSGELASVLENSPMAIVVTDAALQISQATLAAADLFGLKQPILNPHISQCVLPVGFPSLAAVCNETLRLGEMSTHEFPSGESQIVLNCSPYFNANGQISGVTLIVTTFPSLAREIEQILASDEVYMMNRTVDGEIIRLSKATAKLFDIEVDDAIGRNVAEFLNNDQATKIQDLDQQLFDKKLKSSNRQIQITNRSTGEDVMLSLCAIPSYDTLMKKSVVYSVGVAISESEAKLKEAKEMAAKMQILQDFARVGNWSIDLSNGEVFWSPEVHRIHRTDPKTYKPNVNSGIDFYHPDDRKAVSKMVDSAVKKGKKFTFSKRIISADNLTIQVECIGMPLLNNAGEPYKIIGVFREESCITCLDDRLRRKKE